MIEEIETLKRELERLQQEILQARENAFQEVIEYANAHYGPVWAATITGDIQAMKEKK
jgi:hypothetical protein